MMERAKGGLRPVLWVFNAAAGLTVLAIMIVTVVDIAGRYFLAQPFGGTVELTEIGMVLIVFFGLALTERERRHVTIDVLYSRLPASVRRIVGLAAQLVGVAVVAVGGWNLIGFHAQMRDGGYTTAVLGIPIHPLVLAAAAGMALYGLVMVRNMHLAVRHPDEDREGPSEAL